MSGILLRAAPLTFENLVIRTNRLDRRSGRAVREILRQSASGCRTFSPVPAKGDSIVDGPSLFEVGGGGKGFGQIKDIADSYVVNGDMEIGVGNKIPLRLVGYSLLTSTR